MRVRNLALADRHQETVTLEQGLTLQGLTDGELLRQVSFASRTRNMELLTELLDEVSRRDEQ